jgi:hypothetical protein
LDSASLPTLASLAVDRTHGMLVRASAAEYVGRVYVPAAGRAAQPVRTGPSQTSTEGQKPADAGRNVGSGDRAGEAVSPELQTRIVNAMIGAANDPEPTVRASAVKSLGTIGDRRALMPLVTRLKDEVRTVRSAAAEALLWMGVSTLPGAAGELLVRAQDEYAAALNTFPDVVSNQATRGWLESERGRQEEADRVLDTAIALDPEYPRAHVYKGIVAARMGRYADAIKHWQAARRLAPDYPNLDRLIEEAQRRTAPVPR